MSHGIRAVAWGLAAGVVLCIGAPGAAVAWQVGRGIGGAGAAEVARAAGVWPGLLGRTAGVAAIVAVLAALGAWPAGWAGRRLPARWLGVLAAPMLLPSYLAYSGWGLLRAPGSVIGDWLMRGPSGEGPNWMALWAGKVLAVGGLALWAWPLAAVIVGARSRAIDAGVLDALRLEPAGRLRRVGIVAGMTWPAAAMGAGAVWLVMLGSAVPLHVAQLDTYAIVVWRGLEQTAGGEQWRVWVSAWPLLCAALAAGVALGLVLTERRRGSGPGEGWTGGGERGIGAAGAWTAVLMLLSVAAPVVLFAMSLREWRSVATFWRVHAEAAVQSAGVGAAVAAAGAAIGAGVWMMMGSGRKGDAAVARWCVVAFLVSGLVPGILVGAAVGGLWLRVIGAAPGLDESLAPVVMAHVARFGFVTALIGVWLAALETRERRDLRMVDGAGGVIGWALAALPAQAGVLAAGALAMGLLSFHEIEAAVVVQPPGSASFARQMLQLLHFARMEDLAAGVLLVSAFGIAAALAAAGLAALGSIQLMRGGPGR